MGDHKPTVGACPDANCTRWTCSHVDKLTEQMAARIAELEECFRVRGETLAAVHAAFRRHRFLHDKRVAELDEAREENAQQAKRIAELESAADDTRFAVEAQASRHAAQIVELEAEVARRLARCGLLTRGFLGSREVQRRQLATIARVEALASRYDSAAGPCNVYGKVCDELRAALRGEEAG